MLINKYTRSFALEFTAHYLHQLQTYLFMYALKLNKYLAKVQFVTLKTKAEMRQIDLKMENSGNLSMKRLSGLKGIIFPLLLLMEYIYLPNSFVI